ncbi:MAG: chlorophyllase, partial [Clostridiales bacterium]|nr:chlorophyllase [Clostridiales bacterium]
PVFFMVHGAHVSTDPSYLGYEYLGQYLASNGYVVVSVDENIINELSTENDLRAVLLLENMKAILDLNETSGNPLSGLMDPDRIAIGGHSRGGEMVATAYLFNDLDAYPEDGNVKFDYHFNITSIVAIAPVVDQYMPASHSVELSDVNYLLIHGSNDQDVSIMMGEKQYNNVTFTGGTDDYYFKSEVYILGANHGQFNSEWGRYDMEPTGFLNTNNFLDEADQKLIAKAYIRTFLDCTVMGDTTYLSLMSDVTSYEADLPDTVYITNFEDTNTVTICSFDDTVNIADYGNGTAVDVTGTESWTIEPYVRGDGGEGEDYVLSLSWEEESEPVINVSFDPVDMSEGYLSFGIADMREDTEDLTEGLDYTVVLTDAEGNTISIDQPVFIYHSLAVQLYKDDVFFGTYEYKHQIGQVRITPEMFTSENFDFTSVTGLTITTDGTEAGQLIINEISCGY